LNGEHAIVEQLSDFENNVNQLSISELALGEELQALFLLGSLPIT